MKLFIFLLMIFFGHLCFGSIKLNLKDESFHTVPLIEMIQVEIEDVEVSLFPQGYALFSKFDFGIYVIQLLVSHPVDNILDFHPEAVIAVNITFLRSLNKDTIRSFLEEALKHNEVDVEQGAVKSFLEAVQTPVKTGDSIFIFGKRQFDNIEFIEVHVSNQEKTYRVSGRKLAENIFSIWLGDVSYDDSLKQIKQQLLAVP